MSTVVVFSRRTWWSSSLLAINHHDALDELQQPNDASRTVVQRHLNQSMWQEWALTIALLTATAG
jgi:hypothetical protein